MLEESAFLRYKTEAIRSTATRWAQKSGNVGGFDKLEESQLCRLDLYQGSKQLRLHPSFSASTYDYTVAISAGAPKEFEVKPCTLKPRKKIQRTVPIIVLCYGGGPMTMDTLVAAGAQPIIVFKGSGRAAQFIEDWIVFEKKISEATDEVHSLSNAQKANAEENIRRDFAQAKGKQYEDILALADDEKPDWWDTDHFVECLEILGTHKMLSFFDCAVSQTEVSEKARLNPMLPMLATAIFDFSTVKDSAKLQLAIRLQEKGRVEKLLSKNIAIKRNAQELTGNSRMLVYAAFHDMGSIFESLVEHGSDETQLDQLIMLEVDRNMLWETTNHRRCPDWYDGDRRACEDREREAQWKQLSKDEKAQHLRAINWNMLPDLTGQSYDIVRDDQSPSPLDSVDGTRLILRSVRTVERRKMTGIGPDGISQEKYVTIKEHGDFLKARKTFLRELSHDKFKCEPSQIKVEVTSAVSLCERIFTDVHGQKVVLHQDKFQPQCGDTVCCDSAQFGRGRLIQGEYTAQMRGQAFECQIVKEESGEIIGTVKIKKLPTDDTSIRLPLSGEGRY
eukprot:SAG31_NODE_6006_length_2217_cov_2.887158_1_plen_562_part_00